MAVNENDKYYTPHWLVEHSVKKTIEIIGKENIQVNQILKLKS